MKSCRHGGVLFGIVILGLMMAAPAWAGPENSAGTVIAARKLAWAERVRERPVLASKSPVYVGDLLITNEMGRLQVLFQDDSVFMMAPDTEVKVTEYLYGGEDETRFTLDLAKGVTRLISGQMTEKGGKIQVNTPEARVVIQGTTVGIEHNFTGTAVLVLEGEKPTLVCLADSATVADDTTVCDTLHPGFGAVISGGSIRLIPILDIPTYAAANFDNTRADKDTPEDMVDEPPASGEGHQGGTMLDTTQDFQATEAEVVDADLPTRDSSGPTDFDSLDMLAETRRGDDTDIDPGSDPPVGPEPPIDVPSPDRFLTYTGTLSGAAMDLYQGSGAYTFTLKNLQTDAPMVTQVDFSVSLSAMSDGSAAGGIQAQGHGDLATVNADGTFSFTGNAVNVATTGVVGDHVLSGADSKIEAYLPSDSIAPGAVGWQVSENGDPIGEFSGAVTTPDESVDPNLK